MSFIVFNNGYISHVCFLCAVLFLNIQYTDMFKWKPHEPQLIDTHCGKWQTLRVFRSNLTQYHTGEVTEEMHGGSTQLEADGLHE